MKTGKPAIWRRLSTFRRGFVSTFSFDVGARAISAIATVLLIRSLPVDSFAYVILFLNVGQFSGSALTGGIRMRYMRVEAERVSRGSARDTGFALAWVASLMLVVGVAALFLVGTSVAGSGFTDVNPTSFIALTTAFTVGHASIELAMYHHQAHLRFSRAGLIGVGRSTAVLVVAILAAIGSIDAGPAVAGAIAGAVLVIAVSACIPLFLRTLGAQSISAIRGDFGRESGWLTLYYLASAGFAYAGIFVVASFLNDEAVASYGAALRYISIILGPMPALLAVLRVRTSQGDIVDSSHRQAGIIADWIKRAIVPVGVAIGLAAVAAPVFIPILDGSRYPDSIPIFQLLLIPALFNYTTMPGPNLLMTQRRYRLLAGVYAVALAIQLTLASSAAMLWGVVAVAAVIAGVGALEASGVAYLAAQMARRGQANDGMAR